ncbi:MAG TPA: chalcone isomerase family protein [Vicinamibacteria bacterium]|nr:chalcone isomerase family protein [Vicinamibacteria bacterium]
MNTRRSSAFILAGALALTASSLRGQDVTEPGSGVKFAAHPGEMSLLGVGLRTKTFLKVKVYAIGLYVADSALAGPLAAHKAQPTSPAFYQALVEGDFPKEVRLRFVRDLSAGQIQEAMREALAQADKARVDQFVAYFPAIKSGDECVLRWAGGGPLETVMAGQAKGPIADKAFAQALFGVWLGPKPIQDDIKAALVARVKELPK